MEHLFKVNEIFKSIDGEGIRTGLPVTFVRLNGCNLKCSYCDTRYACEGKDYDYMTKYDILEYCIFHGCKRITLTGGEPLLDEHVNELISLLEIYDFEVNVETNGSINIIDCPASIITMDYKSPSSGMEEFMLLSNLAYLFKGDVLKFVVGSKEDLDRMKEIIEEYQPVCNVYVSPIFGMIEPAEIVEYVLENKLNNVRVQVQLHKIIWNPDMRGV